MSIDNSTLQTIYSLLGTTTNSTNTSNPTTSTSFEQYLLNALGTSTSNESVTSVSDYATELLASLQGYSSSTDYTTTSDLSDSFVNSLTSSFQNQILANMNAAKAKLQSSYTDYVERAGANPSEAAKSRIAQMQQNISLVDQYIQSNSTTNSNSLLEQLTSTNKEASTSTTSTLLEQLNANSALTQYLLNT